MIKTSDLIASLAANLSPVKRLRPPMIRAALWLLLAAAVLALIAVSHGLRPNLMERLSEPAFAISIAASLSTGALAAVAAFLVSLPDGSRLWLFLPAPALVVWLSNIGYQCLYQWVSVGPDGDSFGETADCFATLALTSLPLSLALLVMLRYAAPLRPTTVAVIGSLAVGALTAAALSLFDAIDATSMILVWNLGTALGFVGFGAALGRRMLRSVSPPTFPVRS